VRRAFAILVLATCVTAAAQAQRAWQSEIGIQGGFVRIKPAGTGRSDQIDAFAVPGANYVLGLLTHGVVYAIIPWSNKVAVEPSIVFSQLNANGTANTGRLGLRADYALTPKFYAAAGGALLYIDAGGQHAKSLGVHAAVGYRMHLSGSLNSRVELNWTSTHKTDNLNPFIGYGALFGVSTRLGGGASSAPASRRGAAPARAWQPVFGIAGGYLSSHTVGGGDVNGIAIPALGGSITGIGGGSYLGNPPTMFVIVPVGTKLAVEPGLDIVRVQQPGPSTGFSANMSGRLDYAVKGRWYAAAGGSLDYIKNTGVSGGAVPGANVAWGYRFPFKGTWGGRVELNYSMFAKDTKLAVRPQNVFGVMMGVTTPLH
jgi:hypothetical protein